MRAIRRTAPDLCVVTDVCLCEYTDHGHCGLIAGDTIVNDATVEQLVKAALVHARAGAVDDVVATEAEADATVAQLRGKTAFDKLVAAKSLDPSKRNGGDLGWFSPDRMVPPFSQAVAALTKGSYTKAPVQTQYGWHVIRLDDTRDAKIPSYEEVKPQLLEMMMGDQNWQRSKFQAMLKDLREKAKIQ